MNQIEEIESVEVELATDGSLPENTSPKEINKSQKKSSLEEIYQNPSSDFSSLDADSPLCRICFCQDFARNFISPCLCKGTVADVHKACLERWLSRQGTSKCDLCSFQFNVISTLKYKLWESICIWAKHPRNGSLFFYNLICFTLLNIIAIALIGIIVHGIKNAWKSESCISLTKCWKLGTFMDTALFVFIVLYCKSLAIIVNSQVRPWYRWWQTSRNITVIIDLKKE